MKRVLFLFLLNFLTLKSINAEVYFSQDCKTRIIELIKNSKKEILIAVYSIDDPDIVASIFDFIERGGNVKVITDRVQAAGRQSKSPEIYQKIKDSFKINSSLFRIMHDKFAIFDSEFSVNGSFNWTYSAANKNAEDCRISNDKQEIEAFSKRFHDLWNSFSVEETDNFFKKLFFKKKIKKELEEEDGRRILNQNLLQKKNINKIDKKNIQHCVFICKKKCINNEIIQNNIKTMDKDFKNDEIKINKNLSQNAKKNIAFCGIKCKKKCTKKILLQKALNEKFYKNSIKEEKLITKNPKVKKMKRKLKRKRKLKIKSNRNQKNYHNYN